MPSPDARPWEAAALAAVALGALVFQLVLPHRLPAASHHEAAAAVLAREARAGDVVLLQPWWTERFRLFAPAGLPVVGYLGSDADDLEDAERIWVLSQPGLPFARRGAFEAAFSPGRTAVGETRRFGPLALALYMNGRSTPATFRASAALQSARVEIASRTGTQPCGRDPRGDFRCPNGSAVQTGWHELHYVPRRCIALQPPGGAARTVLTFTDVPTSRALVLEAGIVWEHAAKHDPGITPLIVALDGPPGGPPLAVLQIPPGREGMQRAVVPGAGGTLSLSVQSDRAEARHACVELRAVERATSPGAPR